MDVAPYIDSNNRMLVPIRYAANAMGVSDDNIQWNSYTQDRYDLRRYGCRTCHSRQHEPDHFQRNDHDGYGCCKHEQQNLCSGKIHRERTGRKRILGSRYEKQLLSLPKQIPDLSGKDSNIE